MPEFNRAVLFINGECKDLNHLELEEHDFLVAVDGGLQYLNRLALTPHLIIGDMDSIDPLDLQSMLAEGVQIERFPPQKDQTDLELAIDLVLQKGFKRILLIAALGGRLDQSLANLFLLTRDDLKDINVCMQDGQESVFLVHREAHIHTLPGDRLSFLPLCTPVTGISTKGLRYPLNNETLFPQKTRGISNEALSNKVSINIESGLLLCIHTHMGSES